MNETNYRSNSDRSRSNAVAKPTDHKVEKVVTGSAAVKKKGTMRRLSEIFIPEDISDIKSYILMDVIVPSIKKGFHEIGQALIDELFGISRSSNGSGTKISYGSCYRGNTRDTRYSTVRAGNRSEYDDILFDTRADAERVLNSMDDILAEYQIVSVSDMYDLAGVTTSNFTLGNYGWTNIRSAQIIRTQDGYLLKMPKAMPLE